MTAGNASGQNDGAAVCVVTSPETAEELGLTPLLRLMSWGVAGVEPHRMGIGPVPASAAGARAGRDCPWATWTWSSSTRPSPRRCWPCWPSGAWTRPTSGSTRSGPGSRWVTRSGRPAARILTTLAHELHRREGRYALETMCIGGGQGLAAVFERVA